MKNVTDFRKTVENGVDPPLPTRNRDEGAYQLSPTWTQVISNPKPGGRGRLQNDFARLSH